MIFTLRPSYMPSWRVFVPRFPTWDNMNRDANLYRAQESLKSACRWGGHDKEEQIDGIECIGYEFSSLESAEKAMLDAMTAYQTVTLV